ncbi:MAG: hypothetical protein M1827_001135 [Pycnora praestabilis]|nr:MAG: hypothetical protein M1827_001135 [Pycnora praestabilis]
MSLYYEAAEVLMGSSDLKTRIYSNKSLKSPPGQVYALATETTRWSSVLKELIESSQLLIQERSVLHDLVISKSGVALPKSHPLRSCVERHKARLGAEFTKIRLKRGFTTLEDFRAHIKAGEHSTSNGISRNGHPRWVRVNTLRTTLEDQLKTTFLGYSHVDKIQDLFEQSLRTSGKSMYIDQHVPNLIALHPTIDLSSSPAYKKGEIIFQDKASCFPAYLLNPTLADGDIVDACAAPGNKTSHLAALLSDACTGTFARGQQKILACERDEERAVTLQKMMDLAGVQDLVHVKVGQDFLRVNPDYSMWKGVGSLLLDPSCSGSGIIGRDEKAAQLILPMRGTLESEGRGKKRKYATMKADVKKKKTLPKVVSEPAKKEEEEEQIEGIREKLDERLAALSAFQLRLLLHAFSFPSARKITYSTCSIYSKENEEVVVKALLSSVAQKSGWRILRRDEQVSGLRDWQIRGDKAACILLLSDREALRDEVAEACIRCIKEGEEGTMGFFVAGFVRKGDIVDGNELKISATNQSLSSKSKRKEVTDPIDHAEQAPSVHDNVLGEEWQGFSGSNDDEEERLNVVIHKSKALHATTSSR